MVKIANKACIIDNGETSLERIARGFALKSLESAVSAVEPKRLLRAKVVLEGSCLKAGGYSLDLAKFNHIYVLGGGKAGASMTRSMEEVLGERLTAGIVNVPHGARCKTRVVELNEASHPIPDRLGVIGTRRMLKLAKKAGRDDLIICLISGGGSSLMPSPIRGVSIEDVKTVTNVLLKSGASIGEVNVVRKHLSTFKGGWLAKAAYPATILNLVLSDVIKDPLPSIASGPTVADPSTFADAMAVLEKYALLIQTPLSIRRLLSDGMNCLIEETPKPNDPIFDKVRSVVVGCNKTALAAAVDSFGSDGLNTFIVKKPLEGEASRAGEKLAFLARRISQSGKPVSRPAAVVAGGETIVKVFGRGKGGRNQELALAAALAMEKVSDCVIASLSTDGIDGPSDAAGAIVDDRTIDRAERLGLNAEAFLIDNDSYSFHERLGDLIKTGPTGTNVNDITVMVLL